MTPLERVIRPIVEGQIRGFLIEHPRVLDSVDWYKPRSDKMTTFVNSLSKRIVRDLTCGIVTARLAKALLESGPDAPSQSDGGTGPTAVGAASDGILAVAGGYNHYLSHL